MGPKFTVFILVLCLYAVTVNRAQIPLNGPLWLAAQNTKNPRQQFTASTCC